MRITGGQARGITLKLPTRGEIRPATDFLRGAVFSSLGALVENTCTLDVFAGTGAYGLEAISRGARASCFVEKNPAAVAVVHQNAAAVFKACGRADMADAVSVITADALHWTPSAGAKFDLIFCDPPWVLWERKAAGLVARLATLAKDDLNARIVLEAPGGFPPPMPPGWHVLRCLERGKNQPAASILGRDIPSLQDVENEHKLSRP